MGNKIKKNGYIDENRLDYSDDSVGHTRSEKVR